MNRHFPANAPALATMGCILAFLAFLAFLASPAIGSDHGSSGEFPGQERVGPFLERALARSGAAKHAAPTATVVHAKGSVERLKRAIRDVGAEIEASSGDLVQTRLDTDQVRRLAGNGAVAHMRLPHVARPAEAVSEGLPTTEALRFQDRGIRGKGVHVAVLDIGFAGYTTRLGSELPSNVDVKNFNHEGFETTPHGTAVAEVIHDIAPEARITLVSFLTDVEYREAIDWLLARQPRIHVVNASIGFDNIGPLDGTSAITRSANRLLEEGDILYVNSAGNEQNSFYSAAFSDPDGNGWHNFTSGDEFMDLSLDSGASMEFTLNWDDWGDNPDRPGADSDFDLYLWCPGTQSTDPADACFSSAVKQQGNAFDRPLERIQEDSAGGGGYRLGIRSAGGSSAHDLRLSILGGAVKSFEHSTPGSTINLPADGASVLTVGAHHYSDAIADYRPNVKSTDPGFSIEDWQAELPPEPYSSLGPTWDGRHKPDMSAPDCVTTDTFGPEGFCGTSAAAPHVAGAAALLKAERPVRSGAALRRILIATAEDVKPLGADDAHGAGRLNLLAAAQKPGISSRSGLWNSVQQNGHGFFMEARSGRLVVLWYVYDRNGDPVWLMSTDAMPDDAMYRGEVLSFRGPTAPASPLASQFDAAGSTRTAESIGDMEIRFTGDATASVSVSLEGDALLPAGNFQVDVHQFLIGPGASSSGIAYASPYSGLWHLPSQNGHGYIVNRQGNLRSPNYQQFPTDRLLVAWFGYAGSGRPFWVLGSGPMDGAETFQKAGTTIGARVIQSFTGPSLEGDRPLSEQFDRNGHGVEADRNGSFAMDFLSPTRADIEFRTQGSIDETLGVERMDF